MNKYYSKLVDLAAQMRRDGLTPAEQSAATGIPITKLAGLQRAATVRSRATKVKGDK